MDKNYPNNNPRPKRRRSKDNPYHIYFMIDQSNEMHYFVSFTDSIGSKQTLEINRELFVLFNQFELEDISYMNKVDRHYECLPLDEAGLWHKAVEPGQSLEDLILKKMGVELLRRAVTKLSDTQQRRLNLYLAGLTYEQIAAKEGCSTSAVGGSIKAARKKLKKFLKNF